MELIDTHVHLTLDDYGPDIKPVIERAKAAGVTRFVVPGFDLSSSRQAIELGQQYPEIIPAIGLHPTHPGENLESFRQLAALPEVMAIGEVGTDRKGGSWEAQASRLRFFLDLALEVNKPVLLHIRDTWDQTLELLADYPDLQRKAIIHCFTGGPKEAEKIAALGLFLSFTAIIVRTGMEKTCEVVKKWPLDQMMLETDSPWLSWPGEPWPNEPKTVAKIAQYIAKLKGSAIEEVAQKTTQTAQSFFNFLDTRVYIC